MKASSKPMPLTASRVFMKSSSGLAGESHDEVRGEGIVGQDVLIASTIPM